MKTNYLAEYNNGNSYDITIITTGQGKRPAYYEFSNKIKFIDLDINYDEIVSYSFLKRTLIRREKKKKHKTRLEKVLKDIERQELRLVPLCPFVAGYIKKHPDWRRIVMKGINVG